MDHKDIHICSQMEGGSEVKYHILQLSIASTIKVRARHTRKKMHNDKQSDGWKV